jgi:hypothetical protein
VGLQRSSQPPSQAASLGAGSLAGKEIYRPPLGLKGRELMSAFEQFLADHPEMADKPYGDAMGSTKPDERTGYEALT